MVAVMEHDFEPLSGRCRHCGTPKVHHENVPQPCPQQGTRIKPMKPEPTRRLYAVEDAETIHARMIELDADRLAVLSAPDEQYLGTEQ